MKTTKPNPRDVDVSSLAMPAEEFKATLRGLLQTPPPPKRVAKKAKKKK